MAKMITRPTILAAALWVAAEKVDHSRAHAGNWVARRVLMQAEQSTIGVKREPSTVVFNSSKGEVR